MTLQRYAHVAPGEEVHSIAGHYTVEKELLISVRGRDALVVIGHMIIDRSCCGAGSCRYALVPGFPAGETGTLPDGSPFSMVEPVESEADKEELERLIGQLEFVNQIIFM